MNLFSNVPCTSDPKKTMNFLAIFCIVADPMMATIIAILCTMSSVMADVALWAAQHVGMLTPGTVAPTFSLTRWLSDLPYQEDKQ
jgi:hypothetical protein